MQDNLIQAEHVKWGIPPEPINPRKVDKEEEEYELADRILVPSAFAASSFRQMAVAPSKLVTAPYGISLNRFYPVCEPESGRFKILYVGQVSLRKGFLHLLSAFTKLRRRDKELVVIGAINPTMKKLLARFSLTGVRFLGLVPNASLREHYSGAHVFVLPSVEDGFGLVIGEAMACGCPVVATENTGARELITDGVDGFIVGASDADVLLDRLQRLADDEPLRASMAESASTSAQSIGGWDHYGDLVLGMLVATLTEPA